MKGKWVICRHLKSITELKKAEEYLKMIAAPYEVKQLKNDIFSIHVCFEDFKDPIESQQNFQNYISKERVH